MTQNEEIQALKKQLNKERRTNRLLRKKLAQRGIRDLDIGEGSPENFQQRAKEARLFDHDGYARYLAALVRENSLFRLWERLTSYLRRLGLVSITVRIFTYILLLVQTGTVFFLLLVLFLIALPVLAAVTLSIYFTALLRSRRDNQTVEALCKDKRVYVFFPTKAQEFSRGNFWKGNLLDLASKDNTLVVVVAPYFFSSKGLWEKRNFYLNFRGESDRILLIRKHYFFSLRRHVLSTQNTTLIY